MYITDNYICFYSALPTASTSTIKSGFLQKSYLEIYYVYWFVLKNDGLYIYQDSLEKTLYYPKSSISLRTVVSCVATKERLITLKTTTKKYYFKADSDLQRDEWIEAINVAVLKAKNLGSDIKIVLPFSSLINISRGKDEYQGTSVSIQVHCNELSSAKTVNFC
jgi:hypothetical protein